MLLAAMFSIPLWVSIPIYFVLGVLWAFAYLPRSVSRQAKQYLEWKTEELEGQSFRYWLLLKDSQYKREDLIEGIRHERFSERCIVRAFMLDIAFWPLRIAQKLILDLIPIILENLAKWVDKLIIVHLARFLRWVWRILRDICKHIGRFLRWVWRIVMDIWKHLARFLRWAWRILSDIWNGVIVPAYQWLYRWFTSAYQLIIQRANREAIADLEALNRGPLKEKQ